MDDLVVTGWICPECKDEFANPRELEQHFEQNHGAENGIEPRQRIGSTSVRAPRKISGGSGSGSPDVVPIEFPKQGLGAKSSHGDAFRRLRNERKMSRQGSNQPPRLVLVVHVGHPRHGPLSSASCPAIWPGSSSPRTFPRPHFFRRPIPTTSCTMSACDGEEWAKERGKKERVFETTMRAAPTTALLQPAVRNHRFWKTATLLSLLSLLLLFRPRQGPRQGMACSARSAATLFCRRSADYPRG